MLIAPRIYIVDSDKPHTEIVINTPKTKNSLREISLSKELVRIFKSLMKVVNKDYYVLTNNTNRLSQERIATILTSY